MKEFKHEVNVRWADCDPAQIAYTGRLPYFALEAIDSWWESTMGAGWFQMNLDREIGLPFVHLSMDFKSPVTPRFPLICSVRLIRLGESSVRFAVQGEQNSVLCFSGEFVEVFVKAKDHSKASMPSEFRDTLKAAVRDTFKNDDAV